MSKKDFELIARVIRNSSPDSVADRQRLAMDFAHELHASNPRFNVDRFVAACVGEDHHDSAGRTVRYSDEPGRWPGSTASSAS